jgi:hypothetical protein
MTRNALAVAFVLWLVAIMSGPAHAAGPDLDKYTLDPQFTVNSPDGAATVEQYSALSHPERKTTWQFWVRRGKTLTPLEPEQPDYSADFHFTGNAQWIARVQKTGDRSSSLYLYRWTPKGYVAATKLPLSELAWAYFRRHPDSRKLPKPNRHIQADLEEGIEDNYRALGVDWPDSRYLVVSLAGEVEPNAQRGELRVMRGWRCRYDLRTGKFDVPAEFAEDNAKAVAPDRE